MEVLICYWGLLVPAVDFVTVESVFTKPIVTSKLFASDLSIGVSRTGNFFSGH